MKPFVPLNGALVKLLGLSVKLLNCPDRLRDIFYSADNHRVAQNKALWFFKLVFFSDRFSQLKLKNGACSADNGVPAQVG